MLMRYTYTVNSTLSHENFGLKEFIQITKKYILSSVSWVSWIIHRAHCEQFSVDLLSTEEIVPVTIVDIVFCPGQGNRATGS